MLIRYLLGLKAARMASELRLLEQLCSGTMRVGGCMATVQTQSRGLPRLRVASLRNDLV